MYLLFIVFARKAPVLLDGLRWWGEQTRLKQNRIKLNNWSVGESAQIKAPGGLHLLDDHLQGLTEGNRLVVEEVEV